MYYLQLFRALAKEKVRYLVVGGVAVNLHGAERMTMDIDLMLAMDRSNLDRFMAAARGLRLKPAVLPVTLAQFCDAKTVALWIKEKHMLAFQLRGPEIEAPSVDILVKPVVSFQSAYRRRKRMKVGNVEISVAAAEDLIRLKSGTGRKIDESDISALRRLRLLRVRKRSK